MARDLRVGIRLTADGKGLAGTLRVTESQLDRMGKAARGAGRRTRGLGGSAAAAAGAAGNLARAGGRAAGSLRLAEAQARRMGRAASGLGGSATDAALATESLARSGERMAHALHAAEARLARMGRAASVAGRDARGFGHSATSAALATESLARSGDRSARVLRRVGHYAASALAALAGTRGLGGLVRTLDGWTELSSRLRLVSDDEAALAATRSRLFDISQRTRQGLQSTGQTYARLSLAARELGFSETKLLRVTEVLSKQVAIGGATAAEAAAGLAQFTQGIASGRLQGDELRSVMENLLGVQRGLVRGFALLRESGETDLDITAGNIRELAAQGDITAGLLVRALLAVGAETDRTFSGVSTTIGQALTQVSNAIQRALGSGDELAGASLVVVRALGSLSSALSRIDPESVAAGMRVLGTASQVAAAALGVKAVAAAGKAARAYAVATTAAIRLAAAQASARTSALSFLAGYSRLAQGMRKAAVAAAGLRAALGPLAIAGTLAYSIIYEFASSARAAAPPAEGLAAAVERLNEALGAQVASPHSAAAKALEGDLGAARAEASRLAGEIARFEDIHRRSDRNPVLAGLIEERKAELAGLGDGIAEAERALERARAASAPSRASSAAPEGPGEAFRALEERYRPEAKRLREKYAAERRVIEEEERATGARRNKLLAASRKGEAAELARLAAASDGAGAGRARSLAALEAALATETERSEAEHAKRERTILELTEEGSEKRLDLLRRNAKRRGSLLAEAAAREADGRRRALGALEAALATETERIEAAHRERNATILESTLEGSDERLKLLRRSGAARLRALAEIGAREAEAERARAGALRRDRLARLAGHEAEESRQRTGAREEELRASFGFERRFADLAVGFNEARSKRGLDQATATLDLTRELTGQLGAESAKAFKINQAAALASAAVNTAAGVTKALADPGGPAGVALAALVAASGGAQIAAIAAQRPPATGQAHGGLTRVPEDATYAIRGGERIVASGQNADLTRFLRAARPAARPVSVNVTVNVQGGADPARVGSETARGVREALRSMVAGELRPGGLLNASTGYAPA